MQLCSGYKMHPGSLLAQKSINGKGQVADGLFCSCTEGPVMTHLVDKALLAISWEQKIFLLVETCAVTTQRKERCCQDKNCDHVFQHIQSSLLEVIYRNRSNLETIFRIIDRDHSGKQVCRGCWSLPSVIPSALEFALVCIEVFLFRLGWSCSLPHFCDVYLYYASVALSCVLVSVLHIRRCNCSM